MLSVVTTEQGHDELRLDLDQIVREGARRMLAAALEAEVDDYLAAAAERDDGGRRLVVRNGHARQRQVTTAAGAVAVRAPRVDDRRVDPVTGERHRFRSVILPPWCRKSPKVVSGAPGRTRTCNLLFRRQLLCPLSYRGGWRAGYRTQGPVSRPG